MTKIYKGYKMKYLDLIRKTADNSKYKVKFTKLNGDIRVLIGTRPNLTRDERTRLGYNLELSGNVIFKDAEIDNYRTVKACNVISIVEI